MIFSLYGKKKNDQSCYNPNRQTLRIVQSNGHAMLSTSFCEPGTHLLTKAFLERTGLAQLLGVCMGTLETQRALGVGSADSRLILDAGNNLSLPAEGVWSPPEGPPF